MSQLFDQSDNNCVMEQVTLLSLSTSTSCCSSDLISGDEDQSFSPIIPDDTLLSSLLNEEKPLLIALGSEFGVPASARADSVAWILKVAIPNDHSFEFILIHILVHYICFCCTGHGLLRISAAHRLSVHQLCIPLSLRSSASGN